MLLLRSARQMATRAMPALEGAGPAVQSSQVLQAAAGLPAFCTVSEQATTQQVNFSYRRLTTTPQHMQKTYLDERASAAEGSKQHGEASNIELSEEHGDIASEIEKQLQVAQEEGAVDTIFKVVEQFGQGGEFNQMNVATAFCHLSKAAVAQGLSEQELAQRVHSNPQFQNLVDMALATSCSMGNKELTEVLVSAGRLKFNDEMLLDGLSKRLLQGIPSLSPAQLVDAVEGLQAADHSPGKILFDELKHRADEISGQLSPEQKDKLKHGYEHFGYS